MTREPAHRQAPFVKRMPSGYSLEDAFLRLCGRPGCLWLDSSAPTRQLDPGAPPVGRYSFLTSDPIQTINAELESPSPWQTIHDLYASLPVDLDPELPPFQGGIAGLWGYEAATWLEKINAPPKDQLSIPALSVGLYDWTLATDHLTATTWLICQGQFDRDWDQRCKKAEKQAEELLVQLLAEPTDAKTTNPMCQQKPKSADKSPGAESLRAKPGTSATPLNQHATPIRGIKSNFAPDTFPRCVQNIIERIRNGDSFQVNLAQRLLTDADDSSASLYLRLRKANPAPFSVYYHQDEFQIISSSPEGFLQVRGQQVETRPIKGTVRRTGQEAVDRELAEHLIASEKDRAENIMIVDLLRNDLSKSCEDDSVVVTKLCGLEIYQHVQHLVSVVQGKLRDDQSASQLLESCFPGGSVTGAPKIEAMHTIAELEPNRRGAYCGSIGYLGVGSQADFNILIRTITAKNGHWQFPVGGGITARSQPESEEAETWAKAEGMLRAIQPVV